MSGALRTTALALAALAGCDARPDGARYLTDAGFRRARLEWSLVNPENGYSRLRLARYANGSDGDWDRLPEWNPPVAPVAAGGSLLGSDAALDTTTAAHSEQALRELGEAAFFRYPTQLAPFVEPALASPEALARFGLWADPTRGAGGLVSVQLSDGTRGLAITCATCHARLEGAALAVGLPNQRLDLGALAGVAWGPGRVDVAPPPGEEPIAIPDLRPVAALTHLQRDGAVRNDPIALAIRIETLIITSHGGVVRPPRQVALALAAFLGSIAPPAPGAPASGSPAERGRALFSDRCASCHAAPGLSGPPVPLAVVGTDPRVGQSLDRGTGGYRAPSLEGVATRGRLLHDASVPDLDALFDPQRLAAIPGHEFGLHLPAGDRSALLDYLRTR